MAAASRLLVRGLAPSPSPTGLANLLLSIIPNSGNSVVSGGRRGLAITATRPCCKGRKGGSSILRPSPSRSAKIPGAGKKKKPKVHGEPFSRIAKDRRDEEKAKKQAERLKDAKWDENMPPFEV